MKNLLKSVMSIVYCVDVMLIPLILCRPTIEIRNLLTYCHTFIKLVMRTGSYIKTVTNLLMTIFFGHCIDIIRRNLMLINLLQPFRQRLCYRGVKPYATMPIGKMASDRLSLLDWGSRCFSKRQGESMNSNVRTIFFLYQAETSQASI